MSSAQHTLINSSSLGMWSATVPRLDQHHSRVCCARSGVILLRKFRDQALDDIKIRELWRIYDRDDSGDMCVARAAKPCSRSRLTSLAALLAVTTRSSPSSCRTCTRSSLGAGW